VLEDESGTVSKPKEARVQSSAVHQLQKDGTHKKPVFSKVKDNRVNHFWIRRQTQQREVVSFDCGEKGHISKKSRKPSSQDKQSGDVGKRERIAG
jgi:hypothetical protein